MIQLYKSFQGIDNLPVDKLFVIDKNNVIRKHNFHLKIKKHVNTNLALNFFTRRTIGYWNKLPFEVVNSPNMNTFKLRLDKFMNLQYDT